MILTEVARWVTMTTGNQLLITFGTDGQKKKRNYNNDYDISDIEFIFVKFMWLEEGLYNAVKLHSI